MEFTTAFRIMYLRMTFEALPELVPAPLFASSLTNPLPELSLHIEYPQSHESTMVLLIPGSLSMFLYLPEWMLSSPFTQVTPTCPLILSLDTSSSGSWPHWPILGAHSRSSHGPLSFPTITRFAILKLHFLPPKNLSSLKARISLVPLYYIVPGI